MVHIDVLKLYGKECGVPWLFLYIKIMHHYSEVLLNNEFYKAVSHKTQLQEVLKTFPQWPFGTRLSGWLHCKTTLIFTCCKTPAVNKLSLFLPPPSKFILSISFKKGTSSRQDTVYAVYLIYICTLRSCEPTALKTKHPKHKRLCKRNDL